MKVYALNASGQENCEWTEKLWSSSSQERPLVSATVKMKVTTTISHIDDTLCLRIYQLVKSLALGSHIQDRFL